MQPNSSILVVDDEPNLRVSLSDILQNEGYTVNAVGDAREALELLSAGPYTLMFLDLKIPGMDGLSLLREIRRLYPEMPVLILTGNATLESATEAVRQGARDYLHKPIRPAQIIARVAEVLEGQSTATRRREIVAQIQRLVAELQTLDGGSATPETLLAALTTSQPARYLQRGPFVLDLETHHVTLDDKMFPLTEIAFDYLVTLVRHAPKAVRFEQLVYEAQGLSISRQEAREMARWWVHQLRKALEPDAGTPRYVLTVRGTGYRLVV